MAKLNQATTGDELLDILDIELEDGQEIQYRERSSSRDEDWTTVLGLESHLWNLERYNYRVSDPPDLYLEDSEVLDQDGHSINVQDAIQIWRVATRCKKTSEEFEYGIIEGDDRYEVTVHANGSVTVGCATHSFEVIDALARKHGWS